eukprot:gene20651-30646_t
MPAPRVPAAAAAALAALPTLLLPTPADGAGPLVTFVRGPRVASTCAPSSGRPALAAALWSLQRQSLPSWDKPLPHEAQSVRGVDGEADVAAPPDYLNLPPNVTDDPRGTRNWGGALRNAGISRAGTEWPCADDPFSPNAASGAARCWWRAKEMPTWLSSKSASSGGGSTVR